MGMGGGLSLNKMFMINFANPGAAIIAMAE